MLYKFERIDKKWSNMIHSLNFDLILVEIFIGFFALLCSYVGVPIIIIFLFFMNMKIFMIYSCLVLTGLVVTKSIKHLTKRIRPKSKTQRLIDLRWMESDFSFPSGDSYQAAALASFLMNMEIYTSILIVPLVMFARVYFSFHWIGDTLTGAFLGFAVSHAILMILM